MNKDIIEVSLADVLTGKCRARSSILDSKHIVTTTIASLYDIKLVECGEYTQIYYYDNKKMRKMKNEDLNLNCKDTIINKITANNTLERFDKVIEKRSIIRSKLECQRLAKTNMKEWETFITLTFEDTDKFDITDIPTCNKKFRNFIDKVKRVYPEFKYIGIPEFQKKRGKKYGIEAVHYHMLTNIKIDNEKLIFKQEDNQKFLHIKYWIDGFTSVEKLKNNPKKVVGYISKYMTKDIDNRLFAKHRYFYSRNLQRPTENFINLENPKELEFYQKKIQDKELSYQNEYVNPYDNQLVSFLEYIKK